MVGKTEARPLSKEDKIFNKKLDDVFEGKDKLVSIKDIAEITGLSITTIKRWNLGEEVDSYLNDFPEAELKLGKQYKWFKSSILEWLKTKRNLD